MQAKINFSTVDFSTVEYGNGTIHILKPITGYDNYKKTAKSLLDGLSKDFNPQGIDFLLTALIETVNEGYYGINNF